MRECVKWDQKKVKGFQTKEAKCHKCNYDKYSRVADLEVGEMVLIHVTTFKSHHKIQDRWVNREYVEENGHIPMYKFMWYAPGDGEGCSQTLYRNYLLPINLNIGQVEKDAPMAGAENNSTSTPAPSVDSEPADARPSGMVTPSAAGSTPQDSSDWISLLHLDTVC